MDQVPFNGDSRTQGFCAFCGGKAETVDHCPSKAFLDPPYPQNLPGVAACQDCNSAFSIHEEYVAALISCTVAGSTRPEDIHREKVRRTLERRPALRMRIEASRIETGSGIVFQPEHERVATVITKLAKGHALFELNELCVTAPDTVDYFPVHALGAHQRESFEAVDSPAVWPEVGSRAMQRASTGQDVDASGWLVVQPDRYRFTVGAGGAITVKLVIHEYLGCMVQWAE